MTSYSTGCRQLLIPLAVGAIISCMYTYVLSHLRATIMSRTYHDLKGLLFGALPLAMLKSAICTPNRRRLIRLKTAAEPDFIAPLARVVLDPFAYIIDLSDSTVRCPLSTHVGLQHLRHLLFAMRRAIMQAHIHTTLVHHAPQPRRPRTSSQYS